MLGLDKVSRACDDIVLILLKQNAKHMDLSSTQAIDIVPRPPFTSQHKPIFGF